MGQEDPVKNFITEVKNIHEQGSATEHTYRPALKSLLESIRNNIVATNEPKASEHGAIDFRIATKKTDLPICWLEAKDIKKDIRPSKGSDKEQQQRYLKAASKLIYTNCCEWDFYQDGKRTHSVRIADYSLRISPDPTKFDRLATILRAFLEAKPLPISSPDDLAARMAGMASLVKEVLVQSFRDKNTQTELTEQYKAVKELLMHDTTPEEFADIYAETIAYGMFAARLHDKTPDDFSRQEALDLLPTSNPFLKNLFSYIAGPNLDERIRPVIDDLADIFRLCDIRELLSGFSEKKGDPFIHFYEDFLAAYNPKKRKSRGVWYTPQAVVRFIIRSVDEVLQKDFDLPLGLADNEKISIDMETGQTKGKKGTREKITKEVHKVQILDPAAGTGTFLAETMRQIEEKIKKSASGQWSGYVDDDLLPRLHGFELLMASYTMCHIKLDMALEDSGYKRTKKSRRQSVWLTNSLEEGEPLDATLPFAQWLSNEAKGANEIKRDLPIMCVIGNPPYSGHSQNKSKWINKLMEEYKKEPGGKIKLRERNPKWINNDCIKFIRFAEYMIAKNNTGVLGFITTHSWLDSLTLRGMRWHLMQRFDTIHVLDLHGNIKKKEVSPDGSKDENVFDIQQGVAIVIAAKTGKKHKGALAKLYHAEIWGHREHKYKALDRKNLTEGWEKITLQKPKYFFVPSDETLETHYQKGFSVTELMPINSSGIVTARDKFCIGADREIIETRVRKLENGDTTEALSAAFIKRAKKDVLDNEGQFVPIAYRPFDKGWTFYTGKSSGFHERPRREVMQHMLAGDNLGLIAGRQGQVVGTMPWNLVFCAQNITDLNLYYRGGGNLFPLYLYDETDGSRRLNFDEKIYQKIRKAARSKKYGEADEIAVFDYIYGVLHCPGYREKYKEFLKSDFPRIPWPESVRQFWDIKEKGTRLRRLHLIDAEVIGDTPFPFKDKTIGQHGDSVVKKPEYKDGNVWINDSQYFAKVPETAWTFYIGGYQPAQKWLKDRKNQKLKFDDIQHYQRIIKILSETNRIMQTITLEHPNTPLHMQGAAVDG